MKVTQVADWTNAALASAIGETAVLTQNLDNVVEVGKQLFSAGDEAFDNFVRALPDHIGRVEFVDRVYEGIMPSVVRDAWDYGAMREKIRTELPAAVDDPAWMLVDGETYNQDKVTIPKVHAKFWNERDAFMIPISITEDQVKSAFSGAYQLIAFVSMVRNSVRKSMTIRMNSLIRATVNNFIGETIYDEYAGADIGAASHTKAINLLYLYNNIGNGNNLTVEEALTSADFLRFAAFTIKRYISRFRDCNTLFNIGKTDKFTPADLQHIVMLNDFEAAAAVYLYDGKGQFLVDNIKLPYAETVNYWQGTGTDFEFGNVPKIDVVTSEGHSVSASGILAILFDHDALGVSCLERKTKVHRNEMGEFQNTWEKCKAGYWNDFDEQFLVFFIAEASN